MAHCLMYAYAEIGELKPLASCPPPPPPAELRKGLLAAKRKTALRCAVVLATVAAAFSKGALKTQAALRELMPGVPFPQLKRMQDRWVPPFLTTGSLRDYKRSGRPRAAACMAEETALLAAAGALSGYEIDGSIQPNQNVADAARHSPLFQAAMAECAAHGITRPETVLQGVREVSGVDIRSRTFRVWQPTGDENELARITCASTNLQLFTSWREEEQADSDSDDGPPPLTLSPKLYTLVQLDSKKLYICSQLQGATILCGPDEPAVFHGLDDDRLRTARSTAINYYIAVSPLVGVLEVVFVSGTTGLATGYKVSPYSSPCASCCVQASGLVRPWPCMLVR